MKILKFLRRFFKPKPIDWSTPLKETDLQIEKLFALDDVKLLAYVGMMEKLRLIMQGYINENPSQE